VATSVIEYVDTKEVLN